MLKHVKWQFYIKLMITYLENKNQRIIYLWNANEIFNKQVNVHLWVYNNVTKSTVLSLNCPHVYPQHLNRVTFPCFAIIYIIIVPICDEENEISRLLGVKYLVCLVGQLNRVMRSKCFVVWVRNITFFWEYTCFM